MALHATALLSLQEAQGALKLKTAQDDATLELIVNALTLTFEKEAGRPLKQRTLTDYRIDGTGESWVLLPFSPVQSITSISIRYRDDTVYATISDSSKWKLIKRTGRLELFEDVFLEGDSNVLLTMSVGFLETEIEWDTARDLFVMQLRHSWRFHQTNNFGLVSKSDADGSVSFFPPNRLLREVKDGLAALRDHRP